MRIINNTLLEEFRMTERCGWCCRNFPGMKMEPHHVHTRGAGRLDIRINLIPLGGAFQCGCHNDVTNGVTTRYDMMAVVAVREGLMQHEIEAAVWALRRMPKGTAWEALPPHLQRLVERYEQ